MFEGIKRLFRYWLGKDEEGQVISAGGSSEPMPEPTDVCAVVEREGSPKLWKACGHEGHERFSHDFYGEVLKPTEKMLASHDLCGDCLLAKIKAASCRCARCGFAIFPGNAVALYGDSRRYRKEWKTMVGQAVVGCLRWDCCPSGAFFSGHWTPKGFLSAFEGGRTMAEEVMATGKTIVVDTDGEKKE